MGKLHDHIDDDLAAWIRRQRVFFVATAPLSPDGHVNCSPKGGDAFRVLGPHTVAYQDLTGSGVETIAHLRENGRIVIMFCVFEGPPSYRPPPRPRRGPHPRPPGVRLATHALSRPCRNTSHHSRSRHARVGLMRLRRAAVRVPMRSRRAGNVGRIEWAGEITGVPPNKECEKR